MNKPLTCHVEGAILAYAVGDLRKGVLAVGPQVEEFVDALVKDGAQPVTQGALTLRLGVALYDRPFLFLPHSVIDERGAAFQGDIVFDWLRAMAYDMPRSEVFGLNARGREDQVFARDVDVESGPVVVGGPDAAPVYVVARIGAVELTPRFASALKECVSADPAAVRKVVEAA